MKSPRVIGLIALGVLFAAVGWWFGPKAFPLANVDFKITRPVAEDIMRKAVESLDHPLEGYTAVTTFSADNEAKEYIELEHGLPELEQRVREGVAVWYWVGRWFKPGQHEEFSAWVDLRGNLVGFEETLKEEEARPSLDREQALAVATAFLDHHVTQHDPARRKLVSDSVEERPQRQDRSFTWDQENLRVGDAPYRLYVTVHGDRIGTYGEGLKVPEQWTRDYERKRELNQLCENLAGYALAVLMLGMMVFFIRAIIRHTVRWRDAMPWGWIVVFAGVAAAVVINDIPSTIFHYQTTQEWPAFVTEEFFQSLLLIVGAPLGMWLLFVVADAVQTERLPSHAPLHHVLGGHALRDPRVVRAMGIGILAALGGYAYVSLFYVIGARYGVWAPVDVDHSQVLSGYLPWVEAMNVGLSAAFSEEFLFRIIAILLLAWVLRVRWLAVVIAAVVWAFLHSNYPQMPGYIRGVELTVEGIIWGALFLRYGIVCTLTAHYLYNCWLGSMIVMQSASWVDRLGAVTVASWPVLLFLWAVWLGRKDAVAAPVTFAAPPPILPETMRIHDFAPVPLTRKKLLIGSAVGAFLLGMMFLVPLAQERVLELGAHELSEAQILVRADEVMREKGVDPAAYIRTVSSNSMNLPVARYMLQYGSLDQLTAFLKEHWSDVRWEVRYFKILEKEEFTLTLDKWGRLYRYVHHILDEAPGAQLDEAAALALVRSSLLNEHGIDTTQMKLISIDPTKEKNRRDYYVAFEKDNIGWGEAKLRVAISLKGDEPERFSQWVNVPESWTREQRKSGLREVLGKIAEKWTSLAALILGATFLIFLLRRREIPWRLAFVIGLFPFSLAFLDILNDLPHFYRSYSTTTPEANFIIFKVGGMVARLVGAYISGVVLAAVSLGVFRWAFGARLADLVWWPQDRAARQTFLWQTALITIFAVICLRFESFVVNLYAGHVLPSWTASSTHFSVDEALPWLKAITQPLRIGFTKTLSLMFYAGVVILALRRWPRSTWVVLALIPFMGALGADTWSEFFYTAGKTAVSYGLILFLALAVWRFNIVAVFLSYALSTYATWIAFIWTKGGPPYRWEVGPPLVLLVLLVIGVLVLHRRQGIAKLSPTC